MAAAQCDQGIRVATLLALAASVTLAGTVRAQDDATTRGGAAVSAALGADARARLADPALHARAGEPGPAGRFTRVLEGLGLRFQAFESGAGDELALGVDFDLAKSRAPLLPDAPALDLVARGSIAFDPEDQPHDYTFALVRLRWSGARSADAAAASRDELARKLPDPDPSALAAMDPGRFAALSARYAAAPLHEVESDPELRALADEHLRGVTRELPGELLWDTGLHAGIETDQELASRQIVLGGSVAVRPVSWDPDAALSRWNLFDAPAATVRWLAGLEERWRTSGTAWPAVVAGLDVVEASREESRGAVTDDESFLRARLEARMASPVLQVAGETLSLSVGYLLFSELNAPGAVKRAGLDDSSFVQVRLELPRGWSLGYDAGTLPTDGVYDSTFSLGYELRL